MLVYFLFLFVIFVSKYIIFFVHRCLYYYRLKDVDSDTEDNTPNSSPQQQATNGQNGNCDEDSSDPESNPSLDSDDDDGDTLPKSKSSEDEANNEPEAKKVKF